MAESNKFDKLNIIKKIRLTNQKYHRKAEMKNNPYWKMAYQLFLILINLKERYQLIELNDFFH